MKKYPRVSIIIPLYVIVPRFFEDLRKFKKLNYPGYEIIVVCDKRVKITDPKVKFYLTGKKDTGPAEKRDLGIKHAKGEICAFIDDDAYPDEQWLKNIVRWFSNPDIVAVGGPGLTPDEDSFSEKIGGYIIESYLCSGGVQYRFYPIKNLLFVEDYPAYNLLVRKRVLRKVGGYGSTFYGGEDTLLCMKILKYGKIIYDPTAFVYHHRRGFPFGQLKQIAGVGLHRGYFFKKYPETSRKLFYLLPTTLTLLLFLGILGVLTFKFLLLPFLAVSALVLLLATSSVLTHGVKLFPSLLAGLGIIFTHIVYGVYFMKGLLTAKLLR